jgi:alkylation response protein AidB-like acyl-CoA dehydrogenase
MDHRHSPFCLDFITHFSADIGDWVAILRAEGASPQALAHFPGESIRRLAQWEQQTDVHQAHSLPYYVALAYANLTLAFIMTQRHAAIRRIEASSNARSTAEWLPAILSGEAFATVGISHLTTSRRHLAVPPVTVAWDGDRGILHGSIPWVTGAVHAKYFVVGAVDASDARQQYLILVAPPLHGVQPGPGMQLVALTSSCTDVVELRGARIDRRDVLHGPSENVMAASNTGGAGGLQTSALALGLAASAIDYLAEESSVRSSLGDHAGNLRRQWEVLYHALVGSEPARDPNLLRKEANDLVLDATHASLSAAKGAGYVEGHPVGRWCQEALFFLVWSCPPVVADAHLCTFSGWQS